MQSILTNLRWPAIISFLLVIPFMVMEVANRRNFNEGFPISLFIFMWLLPTLFLLTGLPIVRNVRAGNRIFANPVFLLLRIAFMALIVWAWLILVIDQMPCFLGVPNCD